MAVVLLGMIFRSEMWVVIPRILRALGSLHHWEARRISDQMPRCKNGHREYSPIREALAEEGLGTIGEYISFRHTNVAQYIPTQPIFQLSLEDVRQPGGQTPWQQYTGGNKRSYGSGMMGGGLTSWRREGDNNHPVIINNT